MFCLWVVKIAVLIPRLHVMFGGEVAVDTKHTLLLF